VDDVMRELLDDARADTLTPATPPFWVIVRALRDFVTAHGELPLSGELPDMTATTDQYLRLQRVFVDKAAEDRADLRARVAALAAAAGIAADAIPVTMVDRACKNARFLRCFRLHSLADEHALDERTKE
jgi:NEDD8-activating enzyme E1 regulatory subunit